MKHRLLLLVVLIFGFYLRVINLQSWFHFEFDEEVIAWKLRPFLQEGKFFLIGGGTPFGFHLGPAFYYLSAIPLWFAGLDPIGWGLASGIVAAVTIYLMWAVGKSLYGGRVGLIAALLWAASFTAVMSDRHWWPLVLDPMLSLLVILFLYKIEKYQILLNWVWLGLVLAFAWQTDLTVLPLFLATAAVAVMVWREQKKGIMAAAIILLISFLPLVVFEFRYPGQNLGKINIGVLQRSNLYSLQRLDLYGLSFILQSLSRLVFPITHLDGNLLKFYTWCRQITDSRVNGQSWWVAGLTGLIILTPFVSMKFAKPRRYCEVSQTSDRVLRIVILAGVGGIILFRIMGGNLYDFYLAVLYPVVVILAARSADFIWRKWGILAGVAITLLIVGLNLTAVARAYHPQGLTVKQEAVGWIGEQLKGRDFELDSLSRCSRYNGVRYLFFLQDKEPAKGFTDNDLSWLYPNYNQQAEPEYLVTFSTPNDLTEQDRERYRFLSGQAEAKRSFGDLEVLISKSNFFGQESPGFGQETPD